MHSPTYTPAVKHVDLSIVASPLGPVAVHATTVFASEVNAGFVKICVTVFESEPVTCFNLPLLGPNATRVINDANRAVYDFVLTDLESVLAQWAIEELGKAPTVVAVGRVSEPRADQSQYELSVARSTPCEPTRWNNNRTSERVTASYAADSLLEVVAKAYLAIMKRTAEETVVEVAA